MEKNICKKISVHWQTFVWNSLPYFNSNSSHQDISKVIGWYTEDVKNTSIVVNSYLWKGEFIIFNLDKSDDDSLAILLRFDTSLNLQKEIELWEKQKKGL